jgi:hypothetical protein
VVHRLQAMGRPRCNGLGIRRHKAVRYARFTAYLNAIEVYDSRYSYFLKSENYIPSPSYPDVKISDHGSEGYWRTRFVDSAVSVL